MTITVTQIANSQTFGAWLATTNKMANIISQNTVTTDSTSGGSLTTGNGYVNGHFGANYMYVTGGLGGGNVSSNGTLTIYANVAFAYSAANLITLTANSTQSAFNINVNSVNITANTIAITGNATFSNAVSFTNTVTWSSSVTPAFGGNVSVNTSITVGNSTVNAVINSTAFSLSNSTVTYSLLSPNTTQKAANSYFLNANGQWSQVVTSPSGSNTAIQFNDSGSFGGSTALTFDNTSNTLTVTGDVKVTGALKDNSNRTLIVKDSTNTVVWGA